MNSEKFCVDCKWYSNESIPVNKFGEHDPNETFLINVRICNKKLFVRKNLVTGEDIYFLLGECERQRCSDKKEDCGPEGKYFEPKVEWKLEDLFKAKK